MSPSTSSVRRALVSTRPSAVIRPAPGRVLGPDRPAVGGHDLAADGEAEAGPAGRGFGRARLHELIEDRLQLALGDARAVIADRDADRGLPALQRDLDRPAGGREFD